jgi:hypothetical protein
MQVEPMQMDRGASFAVFSQLSNILVKQTRKGWFQECFGCDANTEFNIATMESPQGNFLYALENTSCCIRFCCGPMRPFTINVYAGTGAAGPAVASYERPFRCPLGNCKCCCYQQVIVKDSAGAVSGSVKETCYVCPVPRFNILRADGTVQYSLHQPTCCFGLCVNCCKEGCCNCRIPFYIYSPDNDANEVGKIVKIWGGFAKEILTDADTFEVQFPTNQDAATKARVLGATFLINQLFFERQKGGVE